ncbi:MAG TPA: sugar ABC transporter permease [Solirubrobacteraceae bacterium]|jgi:multiple sugar transport system permease protein|nr:sugar ABC transporter permease [Solirubrobacteraceae bacterium]
MAIADASGGPATALPGNRREIPTGRRLDRERFQWGSITLLLPALVLLVVLFLIPVGYAFFLGFTNLRLVGPTALNYQFTGTANLHQLANDSVFPLSVKLTAIFVAGSVVGTVIVGLALAMLMRSANGLIRVVVGGVVIVAWMMPAVTAGMTWYASTTAGGTFATLSGLSQSDFLHSQPMLIVTLANTWSQCGFAMLVFSAALRNIPGEVIEAATLENASAVQRFRRIILPLLRPTIVTLVLLVTLLTLANFALIYIMTQGGPGNATDILPVYSYQQAFSFNNLAYGALIGDVMVVIATVLGFAYVRASRVRV